MKSELTLDQLALLETQFGTGSRAEKIRYRWEQIKSHPFYVLLFFWRLLSRIPILNILINSISPRFYKLPYKLSELSYQWFFKKNFKPEYDLVFVINKKAKGWILHGICREIAAYHPGRVHFHFGTTWIPPAKNYFFSHYLELIDSLKYNPKIWGGDRFVWYTHPRDNPELKTAYFLLSKMQKVICTCDEFVHLVQKDAGIEKEKAVSILGGADPELFKHHERGNGLIGFSCYFLQRKCPDKILEIAKRLPHRKFILLGRRWEEYKRFDELSKLPNLEYLVTSYSRYPEYYGKMDVYVSTSMIEGGPIPLIETMMSNVVPVVSRTGFCPEVVQHGENGFLFDTDASVEEICDLIEKAYAFKGEIRSTVEHLSWKNFSKDIQGLMRS